MTKRQKNEVFPTMKADSKGEKETEMSFIECQAEIISLKDVETKNFGEKTICLLENQEQGKFQVFVNALSMNNLIDAFGEEDKKWTGRLVDLKLEEDERYHKKMIVLYPIH